MRENSGMKMVNEKFEIEIFVDGGGGEKKNYFIVFFFFRKSRSVE